MKFLMAIFFSLFAFVMTTFAPVSQQAEAALLNASAPMMAEISLGSISADADTYGIYLHKKSKIVSVKLVNSAGISQSDTDKAVVTLQNGSTVIATHSTALTGGTSALVANTPANMTITAANSVVAAGSYLKVAYDESGTYAMTTAKVIVVYYPL